MLFCFKILCILRSIHQVSKNFRPIPLYWSWTTIIYQYKIWEQTQKSVQNIGFFLKTYYSTLQELYRLTKKFFNLLLYWLSSNDWWKKREVKKERQKIYSFFRSSVKKKSGSYKNIKFSNKSPYLNRRPNVGEGPCSGGDPGKGPSNLSRQGWQKVFGTYRSTNKLCWHDYKTTSGKLVITE